MLGKCLSTIAVSVAIMAASPASADCSSAIKTTEDLVMKSTDPAKKNAATKEIAAAKELLAKKDEAGCMMHLDNATKSVK